MSLVSSSIDDYLVASFPLPAGAQGAAAAASSSFQPSPPVTAVQYTAHARQDGRLAVATPGVGVSVYDLADQTPLSSITVGPSFSPTTAAVSRSTPSTSSDSIRVKSARRTWVGVRTEEGKGEIWCWHEEEKKDGSTEGDAGKAIWPVSEPLAALTAPRTLPSHIAFLSSSGALALAPSDDLTSLASLPAPSSAPLSQTLRLIPASSSSAPSFLPAPLAALLPPSASSEAHVAVIVRTFAAPSASSAAAETTSIAEIGKKKFKKTPRASAAAVIEAAEAAGPSSGTAGQLAGRTNEIELVLLDPKVSVPDEMEPRLGLFSLGKVVVEAEQVVVSDDGFVTAFNSANGTLASSRLAVSSVPAVESYATLFFPPSEAVEPSSSSSSAGATLSLSPIKALSLSSTALTLPRTTLLALHSSFVLLASPRPTASTAGGAAAPVVSASLWDARFGSAIATTELTVPAAVASSISDLALSLSLPAKHTAILTLSPSSSTSTSTASAHRTALFGLPLSPLPTASVLAAVVGKHALTAPFLASATSSGLSSVLAQAKRAEPLRSAKLLQPQNEKKLALLDASKAAREALLEALEAALLPLKDASAKKVAEQDRAVQEAERLWDVYLDGERDRLLAYNRDKVRSAMEKEQERKLAVLRGEVAPEGQSEAGENTRYLAAKRKIERALKAAGAGLVPGEEVEGQTSWKEVTGVRIKGVTDSHRYKYQRERQRAEEELGKTVKDFDVEDAVAKVERYEPSLPSSFITALFRLSFPLPLDAPSSSTDLAIASSSAAAAPTQVFRHPAKIVGYFLQRELVGENQVLSGVTRFLARAGDWTNILVALRMISDIPESTTVSLLAAVLRASPSSAPSASADAMDIDTPSSASSTSLPQPTPSLTTFLPAFLLQPSTPATLRAQLQSQLTPAEAVQVLELCDGLLAIWLQAGKAAEKDGGEEKKVKKSKGAKTVGKGAAELFRLQAKGVPPMEQIIPLVQSLLDAHFVTLLLQRQAHPLLRRLSKRVSAHTQLVTDLASLGGALAVYARKRDEGRKAEERRKRSEESERAGKAVATAQDFGEKMERRIQAQEKHAEVGEYSIEDFFL
ncbi:hypothetical protein JCM6882_004131 [Rhodosporidiobolus microsporus]